MSVRGRSSLTNKRLKSGKSALRPERITLWGAKLLKRLYMPCDAKGKRRERKTKLIRKSKTRKSFKNQSEFALCLCYEGVQYGQWTKLGESIRRWHVTTRVENNRMILLEEHKTKRINSMMLMTVDVNTVHLQTTQSKSCHDDLFECSLCFIFIYSYTCILN
nr:PREDICTED: uncharacterized protein LOC107399293 [Tribolium castaneum]|eukprot:XP_015840963.1 PREDICTED: uncharacterized protein LOC107399293 [Tribolium castaneum]